MKIPVVQLTRECQHVWDGDYGRVRCGRLAYVAGVTQVNGEQQIYFRCYDHENDDPIIGTVLGPTVNVIEENATFGLGYTP